MANFGIGIGAFAQGVMQGMQIGKMYRDASKQWDAEKASKDAIDAARQDRESAVQAEQARIIGLGPQGPQAPAAPSTTAAPATTQPVDMSTPTATPIQNAAASAASATAPTPAPTASLSPGETVVPPDAMKGTPMADSGSMAPAPSPADAVGAARALDSSPARDATASTASMPAAAPTAATAATRGLTGGAPMSDTQARALAEKNAPSVMDFFRKKGVPKIAETYLAQGDPAKAQAWMDWSENADNQKNLKTWAKAWRATQMGDIEGAADHFMELYKSYDDGVTPVSKEVVKDKDGNVTGFNVKLKNDATGEERSSFIDRSQLLEMGLAALSPPQMFEAAWKRQQMQDKAKSDAQVKAGEIKMETAKGIAIAQATQAARGQNEITLQKQRHEDDLERDVQKGKIDSQNQQNKVQNELDAKIGALQGAGYSSDFIKEALPQILGLGQYKKATSPEEAKRLAFSDRMKNDPSFSRLPVDKQRSLIEQDMNLIYGGLTPGAAPAGGASAPAGASGTTANPFGASPPAARGLPVLDTRTGKVVYK